MAYANEFRAMLKEHPGIIRTAIGLANRAVDEYDPPDNPIPGYYRDVRFDKKTGKWLEEERHILLNEQGKTYIDPVSGKTATKPVGWKDLTFGRGTILVPGKPVTDENTRLELTVLGRSNREMPLWSTGIRFDKCDYFKVGHEGHNFFVKRSIITNNPGFNEFRNTILAKEVLKNMDFVKVVEAQLGYEDQNESWYVSKWEDLEKAGFGTFDIGIRSNDYGEKKEGLLSGFGVIPYKEYLVQETEYKEAEKKADLIRHKLYEAGIHHDVDANLFYNIKTRTFILLDVAGEPTKALGNPIREK